MAKRYSVSPRPNIPVLPEDTLERMRATYRQIRKSVYEDATRPKLHDVGKHEANKQLLQKTITEICDEANLAIYSQPGDASQRLVWNQLWKKIRYAGFKAETATLEIASISDLFDDYEAFTTDAWVIDYPKKAVTNEDGSEKKDRNGKAIFKREVDLRFTGPSARDYFKETGAFEGKFIVHNIPKLIKTRNVAIEFKRFFARNPQASGIEFVCGPSGGINPKNVWEIHRRIQQNTGYKGSITALHFMMDVGFEVVKPDRVMARAFYQLGWLHQILDLPSRIKETDIVPSDDVENEVEYEAELDLGDDALTKSAGQQADTLEQPPKGVGRYHYLHPQIYKSIVEASRQIVSGINKADLIQDIGWATDNPLREFDIFMVKYGQDPETKFGLERNMNDLKAYRTFAAASHAAQTDPT